MYLLALFVCQSIFDSARFIVFNLLYNTFLPQTHQCISPAEELNMNLSVYFRRFCCLVLRSAWLKSRFGISQRIGNTLLSHASCVFIGVVFTEFLPTCLTRTNVVYFILLSHFHFSISLFGYMWLTCMYVYACKSYICLPAWCMWRIEDVRVLGILVTNGFVPPCGFQSLS